MQPLQQPALPAIRGFIVICGLHRVFKACRRLRGMFSQANTPHLPC